MDDHVGHRPPTLVALEPLEHEEAAGGGDHGEVDDEGLLEHRPDWPEALQLAREVGLETELVAPDVFRAGIYSRGRVRPMPRGQVMGIPTDLRSLAASGVMSRAGLLQEAGATVLLPAASLGLKAVEELFGHYVKR